MNEIQVYDLAQPQKAMQFSSVLADFLKQQKLTTKIQGKEFVNVEGWQYAGSQFGLLPILTSLANLSTADELKYRADVDLVKIGTGEIIGRGIAICSNKERTKRAFEEYAIASMAQTRAEGKAFRMLLSWLMKAAGYEGTPTEEMIDTEEADEVSDEGRQFLQNLLESSSYEGKKKEILSLRIDSLTLREDYEKAKADLMNNQLDRVSQGSANSAFNSTDDITKHVRKLA